MFVTVLEHTETHISEFCIEHHRIKTRQKVMSRQEAGEYEEAQM